MNFETVFAYFDERTERDDSTHCWNWTGSILKRGYGSCNVDGMKTTAHRAQYWLFVGHIERGHEIHHKCHNPRCVNLDHLESLPVDEHAKVGIRAMQTHCINDHEFSPENTYFKVSNGTRACRKCAATRQRERRIRK